MNLKDHIRSIPDFPKPGILFYDISTLLAHPKAWHATIERMAEAIRPHKPDVLAGIESRGFLLAAPLALALGTGFVMLRKQGKLPGITVRHTYALEYGTDTIEIQADAIDKGVERVQGSFPSQEEYESKKREVGLTDADVRKMVASQLYLSNYLDSRFRPSVHVEAKDIQDFYEKAVIPRAQARGQEAPSLDAAKDVIREALIQTGIDEQANRWLAESRSRIVVEKMPEQPEKSAKDETP